MAKHCDPALQKVVGKNLAKARRRMEMKMSLEGLALASHADLNTVGRIERGTYNPTIGLLSDIAKAVGVEVEDLVSTRAIAERQGIRSSNDPGHLRKFEERADALEDRFEDLVRVLSAQFGADLGAGIDPPKAPRRPGKPS